MSVLHELQPEFEERLNTLSLILGLLSFSMRWMRLVRAEARRPQPDGLPTLTDQNHLYFLLGAVSFASHLNRRLLEACPPLHLEIREQTDLPDLTSLRGLLR
jgi:hypothetical protein